MLNVHGQYLLTYAIQGCVFPYAAVLLRERGLDETGIGLTLGLSSFSVLITPALLGGLADARVDPRKLLAGAAVVVAGSLLAAAVADGAAATVALWVLFSLALQPMLSLQDGLFFAVQRVRAARGLPARPYHRVRVWGTVGFILPTLALLPLLDRGMPTAVVLVGGAVVAALCAGQALLLPDPRLAATTTDHPAGAAPVARDRRLPTVAALRAFREPHVLVFVVATCLIWAALAGFMTFFPLYATDRVGIDRKWLGAMFNVGVLVEVFFVLAAGRLTTRLGLRALMLVGVGCVVVRIGLCAGLATVAVAVGTQLVHGIQAVVMQVVPPTFLDRHADDEYRHSMQGLYLMLGGAARGAGVLLAGPVVKYDVQGAFGLAAGLAAAAWLLLLYAFREPEVERAAEPAAGATAAPRASGDRLAVDAG